MKFSERIIFALRSRHWPFQQPALRKQTSSNKSILAAIALLTTAASPANAAIILSGNLNTGTPTPTLTITDDIDFDIIGSGFVFALFFSEWTTADSVQTALAPMPVQNFAYELNGSGGTTNVLGLYDNIAAASSGLTPNDGYMGFGGMSVANGDSLKVLAGTYTFGSNPDFNPLLNGITFTGNVFLTDISSIRMSNIVAVPEPSSVLLVSALSLSGLLRRKR